MATGKVATNAKAKDRGTPAGVKAEKPVASDFVIVGLGASAGGLEAFEQFFRKVSPKSGMAFVLVQHLDPGHDSILTGILQRSTEMPVVEAQDQMAVAPNHVYVIPPNRDMAIFHGILQLSMPEEPRGHRMPIDAFLHSLAEDQGKQAIGIILSGTGSDGTLGLRAILGAGGVSLVQEPTTAKYDGMPVSAIKAGNATHVVSVENMPEVLLARMRIRAVSQEAPSTSIAMGGVNHILMLLRSGTNHDFSQYKRTTIGRRIERRMSQHGIENMEVYARYLKEHPAEVHTLFKELLINVTSFFRDPEAFATLKKNVLPKLFADKPEGYVFRIWVAGCASGEEAYSIAMLLREFMDETQQDFKVQIYSTDLDEDAIGLARAGVYPLKIAQNILPERLRFFVKEEATYRVKKDIRESVVFATQNVIKDPPFTKLDLVSCRNLLIYLEAELQNNLIAAFHYALKPGGVLFLSPSENTGKHSDLFAPLSRKWKLYQAIPSSASARAVVTGGLTWTAVSDRGRRDATEKRTTEIDLAELTKRMLLKSFAPASVVTDLKGNILYVHGETGKYLCPAPGKATLNVVEMARGDLKLKLRAVVHSAASLGARTPSRELSVKTNGDLETVSLTVRPLPDPDGGEALLLVSFRDLVRARSGKSAGDKRSPGSIHGQRIQDLERDLAQTKEHLQESIEEQQASTEELKSMNEEMQSTNEELQSTNEELESSKEELQSVNEELVTVNTELHAKIEQLTDIQNDMKNLLDNINIGTVFLDEHLAIRRFTREAAQVYRLVASDVGRPLGDIKSILEGEDLIEEAQVVLDSLVSSEREVHTRGGAWYQARIQPYRTLDNMIAGVVLTFADISKRVEVEAAVQEARELAEGIVDTVREPLVVLDGALKVVSASTSFYRDFQVKPEETLGRPFYELGNHQWDIPALRELLETVLPRDRSFEGYTVEHEFPGIGWRKMQLNARRIVGKLKQTQLILLAIEATALDKNETA